MTYTAVMAAVLIGSFALMFGLVKFSESIIVRNEFQSTGDDGAGVARKK